MEAKKEVQIDAERRTAEFSSDAPMIPDSTHSPQLSDIRSRSKTKKRKKDINRPTKSSERRSKATIEKKKKVA